METVVLLIILFILSTMLYFQRLEIRKTHDSVKMYKLLTENSEDVIWCLDGKGRFVYHSPSIEKMTGYTVQELNGTHFSNILDPVDAKEAEEIFKRFALSRIDESVTTDSKKYKLRKKNGELLETEITFIPYGDEKGVFQGVHGVTHDIQRWVEAEDELRKSRERLSLALEATGFDIWENNFVTGEVSQPDSIYQSAGYDKGDIPLNFEEVKSFIHPDDLDAAFAAISEHLEGKSKRYHAEFRFKRKDGSWMWLANYGKVYEKNEEGVPLKFIGLTLDITEKKETELSLERLNKELEKRVDEETEKRLAQEKLLTQQSKMAMMGEMVSIIAHQWKQPLNALNILIYDLAESYQYKELNQEFLDTFKSNSLQQITFMSETIDEFRTFLMPSKEACEFHITESVKQTIQLLERMFQEKKITINLNVEANVNDKVKGFKNEFMHVILNILSNAKDAYIGCASCSDRQISIDIANRGDLLNLKIWDRAGGIPKEHIDHIFDAYMSTKGNDGTGIGLNIVKTIVERMGGNIVASNQNGGALFTITLPTI